MDCLMNSMILQEIALTETSSQAFETIFERDKEDYTSMRSGQPLINTTDAAPAAAAESKSSIILFVTIQGSEQLQGVCKVSNH